MEIVELIEYSPEGFLFRAGGILPPACLPGDIPDRFANLHQMSDMLRHPFYNPLHKQSMYCNWSNFQIITRSGYRHIIP
jgi:hypothetical protein